MPIPVLGQWSNPLRGCYYPQVFGFLITTICHASPQSWTEIQFPDVCRVQISPDMSIDSILSDPKAMLKVVRGQPNTPLTKFTKDQLQREKSMKILKITQASAKNYMRILINAIPDDSSPSDPPPEVNQELLHLLAQGVEEQEFGAAEQRVGIHRLTPIRTDRTTLGGWPAGRVSYTRQLNSNPPVTVEHYFVFAQGRLLKVSASYRCNERELWEAQVRRTLSSIVWLGSDKFPK